MASSMWRMNGLWRRMAGVLVLCALLLSNKGMCQEDTSDPPAVDPPAVDPPTADPPAADSPAADPPAADPPADTTAAPDAAATAHAASTVAGGKESAAIQSTIFPATIRSFTVNQGGDISGTIAAFTPKDNVGGSAGAAPRDSQVKMVKPTVKCVGEKDIPESNAVKAVVKTADCEATKDIIENNPASWCHKDNCSLEIFQDGKSMLVASEDAKLSTLVEALKNENLKNKLGLTKTEIPSSSGSSVFVGILVTGLLAAIALTVGYFKCQRKSDTKGVRLAEEAYPLDQENQGNTLVSVAPLNPPPETQEKPSVNGESPEAAKTELPPSTNGHSTAKTADTEL